MGSSFCHIIPSILKYMIMNKAKIARIVSEISNGFLTMILTPLLAIGTSTLGTKLKIIYSLAYLLVTILPYLILKKLGKASDYEFTNRKERPPYFITVSLLFGLLFLILKTYSIPTLTDISLALFVVASVITIVTFFWKISGHMTYSTLLFMTLGYIFSPYVLLLFLFSPFIGWSRIVLKKHTLGQVIAGTIVTATICILIYWVF